MNLKATSKPVMLAGIVGVAIFIPVGLYVVNNDEKPQQRPSKEEIVTGIEDGKMVGFEKQGPPAKDTNVPDCWAEAFVASDVSAVTLNQMLDGNNDYDPPEADMVIITRDVVPEIVRCTKEES